MPTPKGWQRSVRRVRRSGVSRAISSAAQPRGVGMSDGRSPVRRGFRKRAVPCAHRRRVGSRSGWCGCAAACSASPASGRARAPVSEWRAASGHVRQGQWQLRACVCCGGSAGGGVRRVGRGGRGGAGPHAALARVPPCRRTMQQAVAEEQRVARTHVHLLPGLHQRTVPVRKSTRHCIADCLENIPRL